MFLTTHRISAEYSPAAAVLPMLWRRDSRLSLIHIYLHTRLESMPKHNKVCHGDFNPSNVIITDDGTPYIIDWSHATQGRCV